MTDRSQHILAQAMSLSPMERAELVEGLLATFDFPSRTEIDTLWRAEVEDRLEAFERGDMQAIPADEVFRRIQRPSTT